MYKGFNLVLNDELNFKEFLLKNYCKYGKEICKAKKEDTIEKLQKYVGKDGSLDCTALQRDWFPEIKSNIFISHSHADEDLAVSLAGWFHKEFKLESFIDSYVWGYCNDLLKEIDNEYCRHSNGNSYDYDKRNDSTSHVHMMLSTALNQMINKTECIIFLNTDKSILKTEDNINDGNGNKTRSPWIYSELVTTKLIEKNIPNRLKMKKEAFNESFEKSKKVYESEDLKPTYDLDHLIMLSEKELNRLCNKYKENYPNKPTDALDEIYIISHIINKLGEPIYD